MNDFRVFLLQSHRNRGRSMQQEFVPVQLSKYRTNVLAK